MKNLKSEKGAITMITLITILFMISFLITSYILVANKVKTQKEMLAEIQSIYEPKATMEEIYNSYFTNDHIIPIYTTEQLMAIGNGEKINVGGKVYTFQNNKNTTYLLKNNLEFNASDLELETDWIPPYEDTNFVANFDWNGHTVKVTELSGNVITYDGRYLVTKTNAGKTVSLTKATKSNLVDLKIFGNSIQNGTPTTSSPVEIQSVGDKTVNLFDISNYTTANFSCLAFDASNLIEGEQYTFVSSKPITWFKISDYPSGYNSIQNSNFNNKITNFTFTMTRNQNISETSTQYIFIGIGDYSEGFVEDVSQLDGYNIQIQKGSVATEYEPYGKYKIPIKVNEKNLFNVNNITTQTQTTYSIQVENDNIILTGTEYACNTGNTLKQLCPTLKSGENVTLSFNTTSSKKYIYLAGQSKFLWVSGTTRTITEADLNADVCIYNENSLAESNEVIISNIQIEKGNEATTYVEYNEPKVVNMYLDEPLRKVGTYYDYIDLKNKKLIRNVEVIDDTGSTTIENSYRGMSTSLETEIDLPDIQLYKGTNTITVETKTEPYKIQVTYNSKQ